MLARLRTWARSRRTWVVVLLLAVLAALATPVVWAQFHMRAARRALEHHDYSEARRHLEDYLRIFPRSATARLLALRCARSTGDFDRAATLLADCERLHADREAVVLEGHLLDAQRGALSTLAAQALQRRVEHRQPETPLILEALAQGFLYTNRLGEAMGCIELWLAYAPGDSQALYLRGLVWEGMGDLPKATEDCRQALRRDPEHPAAREQLAWYLVHAKEADEAASLFEGLVERQPERAKSILGLARCRHLQGRFDDGERLLDDLISRGSPPVAALVLRARLAQQQGDLSAGEKWYRQALAQDAFDHEACLGLAHCLRGLGYTQEAQVYQARTAQIEADLKRLTKLHEQLAQSPDNIELAYEAGMICLRNGQATEARRWFRNVLGRNPRHEGTLQELKRLATK